MELKDFLSRNRIDVETWQAADIEWSKLIEIYNDYVGRLQQLEDTASFFVKSIQAFDSVHSVRWRVKDPEHLAEKIIRKRAEKKRNSLYAKISVENYHEIVTDLIGIRALHLFKDDCLKVHDQIIGMWESHEPPKSYIRQGDMKDFAESLDMREIKEEVHPAGYRSIHYVLKTKPALREVLVEVQVRTIFEEAWSEIDHKVRYPNFSKNRQVEYVLQIFNRIAGSADEIGRFVRDLSFEFDLLDDERNSLAKERDVALAKMDDLISELANANESKAEIMKKVEQLQGEMIKVRSSMRDDVVGGGSIDISSHHPFNGFESDRYFVAIGLGREREEVDSILMSIDKVRSVRSVPRTRGNVAGSYRRLVEFSSPVRAVDFFRTATSLGVNVKSVTNAVSE